MLLLIPKTQTLWGLEIYLDPAFSPPDAATFMRSWLPLGLYLGGGASLVAFLCWNKSIEYIGAAKTSTIYLSLPVFSGLEALALLGEPILAVHFVSAACVGLGIFIGSRK